MEAFSTFPAHFLYSHSLLSSSFEKHHDVIHNRVGTVVLLLHARKCTTDLLRATVSMCRYCKSSFMLNFNSTLLPSMYVKEHMTQQCVHARHIYVPASSQRMRCFLYILCYLHVYMYPSYWLYCI